MEEDLNSVEEEVTPQDQEPTIVDEVEESQPEDEAPAQETSQQEMNFKNLRKKEQEAQRRAEEAERKTQMQEELIKQLLQNQQVQQGQQVPEEVDEFDAIPDDEYLPKGKARKFFQKDARQIAREEFQALEREREKLRFRERLKSEYSDFDDVVTTETIAIFEQKEPKLAATIAELKDPYKMGLQTYHLIKSMGFKADPDEERHAKEVKKKLEKNEKTVQSPQAFNKRPMAKAFDITHMSKDEQAKLYEEMMGHASRSGGGY